MSSAKKWQQALLKAKGSTLLDGLNKLNEGVQKIVLAVDDHNRLIGVLCDGDFRRALVRGATLQSPLEDALNKNPISIGENTSEVLIRRLFKDHAGVYRIPILDRERRVLGMRYFEELSEIPDRSNRVVIMAGGQGLRLRPLTESTPKPMLPVGGRPMLETLVERCVDAGYKNFTLSVNYLAEVVEKHFGDGARWGVKIDYVRESKRLGTAGAVAMLGNLENDVVVMNGDLLTTLDFGALLDFHLDHQAAGTMCVKKYDIEIPYGVVQEELGVIASLEEKPVQTFNVNAGIYCLSPAALKLIPTDEFFDMPSLFRRLIDTHQKTIVYPIHDYWMDVGKIQDYNQAVEDYPKVFGRHYGE